ncbi:TauD/TfdA dioxygenase family protein [Reyranella sp.]|uniref:TauD/TfdA dioxygenase family protein n=1 Tax=Reyranella sp. TaxID=1929291 RepID=UPI003BAB736F
MTTDAPRLVARPLTEHLAAEVASVDLRSFLDGASTAPLLEALTEHAVLVFPEQTLTPDELLSVSRLLGELEPHVLDQYCMASHRDIYVLSNVVENGRNIGNPRDGFGWHTDLSYFAEPTAYTLLYGVETPTEGGDTLFCSTYAAFETLPDDDQERLRHLRGLHSYRHLHAKRRNAAPLTAGQLARTPDVTHPMIRIHPMSGRRSLYLGGNCLAGLAGVEDSEAWPYLDRLFAHATQPAFQYRHRWRPRDVLIWDNRGTMHTATEYDHALHRRVIWRTSVRGEAPL